MFPFSLRCIYGLRQNPSTLSGGIAFTMHDHGSVASTMGYEIGILQMMTSRRYRHSFILPASMSPRTETGLSSSHYSARLVSLNQVSEYLLETYCLLSGGRRKVLFTTHSWAGDGVEGDNAKHCIYASAF